MPQIYTRCSGNETTKITGCIRDISNFIRMHDQKLKEEPARLTCRVNHGQLESNRMHWHIHYYRPGWKKIIESVEELNCYAEDIGDEKQLFAVFAMIDIFKHEYSKVGFKEHHFPSIVHLNIGDEDKKKKKKRLTAADDVKKDDDDAATEKESVFTMSQIGGDVDVDEDEKEKKDEKEMSKEDKELTEAVKMIKDAGFKFAKQECRIWRNFELDESGKIVHEKEIFSVIKMTNTLKQRLRGDAFSDQRFGLDFESKSIFVEIRPSAYFKIYGVAGGKIRSLIKMIQRCQSNRFTETEKRLVGEYGQEKVEEVRKYAAVYFKKHPALFDWHKSRH